MVEAAGAMKTAIAHRQAGSNNPEIELMQVTSL